MITQKLNRVLLFAILIISFFGMNLEEGKAQCPPGYSPYSSTMTYQTANGPCVIHIFYCLRNSAMGMNDVIIQGFQYSFSCIGYVDITDINFWEDARLAIISDLYLQLNIPPCSESSYTLVNVEASQCWKLKVEFENNILISRVLPCSGELGFCNSVYQLCFDYSQSPPNRTTKISSYSTGSPNCLNGPLPNFIPNTFPYESDCYYTCE